MADIGRRLLPTTIDKIALETPERIWASMPSPGTLDFHDISFSTFANAINRTAWWIVNIVGRPQPNTFPTIAYLGPSDLRYYVMLVAIVKSGYKALFLSHRNSIAANVALFESTKCTIFLHAFEDPTFITSFDHRAVHTVHQVPSSGELWNSSPADPFPFEKSFNEAYNDPFVILHTSGSTGLPKPVVYSHAVMAAGDLRQTMESPPGAQTEIEFRAKVPREILGLPPFHAAGLLVGLQNSVWYNRIIVFPPAERLIDGPLFHNMLKCSDVHAASLLPDVLEQLARMPEALETMSKQLTYLVWVGGPISNEAGNAISAVTELLQSYASTEMGSTNVLTRKRPEDWNYHWFNPGKNGFDFRPVDGDDHLYELFVVRQPDFTPTVFHIFRDIAEWPTHDLFSEHPTTPGLWRHEGRSDDLIVLENGGKLNPRPIETFLRSDDRIRDAIVIGSRRPRPLVIIEPSRHVDVADEASVRGFVDEVMSAIDASNTKAPANGQIVRELVTLVDPGRPFPRTGKGTIQHRAAMQVYEDDVDKIYASLPEHLRKAKVERVGHAGR